MPAAVPRVAVQCPMCPTIFQTTRARLARGAGKYCSVPCQVLSQQVSPEQRHATKLRASRRTRAKHKAKLNAKSRAYVAARREAMAVASLAYYHAHKDERVAYRVTHPEVGQNASGRYRARKKGAPVIELTTAQWREIKAAYGYRCVYCPPDCAACETGTHALTQDHVTPFEHGGSHTLVNIVPACKPCNRRKWTGPPPVPVQPLLLTLAAPRGA